MGEIAMITLDKPKRRSCSTTLWIEKESVHKPTPDTKSPRQSLFSDLEYTIRTEGPTVCPFADNPLGIYAFVTGNLTKPIDRAQNSSCDTSGTSVRIAEGEIFGLYGDKVLRDRWATEKIPLVGTFVYLDENLIRFLSDREISPDGLETCLVTSRSKATFTSLPSLYQISQAKPKSDSEFRKRERKLDAKLKEIRQAKPDLELDGNEVIFPDPSTINSADRFLVFLKSVHRLPDDVMMSIVGGVGFTWWKDGRKVYIEFRNTGNAHALFNERRGIPRVIKVNQSEAGFQSIFRELVSYLDEQNDPAHSSGNADK